LLEYACTFLPAQQNAVVEAVSKSEVQLGDDILKAIGLEKSLFEQSAAGAAAPIAFTSLAEIENAVRRRLRGIVPEDLVRERIDFARGRI
jgi:hypothetical protein